MIKRLSKFAIILLALIVALSCMFSCGNKNDENGGDEGKGNGTDVTKPQEPEKSESIMISVFWPPTKDYLDGGNGNERWDEQYKLLSDANIDLICNVTGNDLNATETNLKMAEYANKYGMSIIVADTRFGQNLLGKSESEIAEIISDYRDVPGVAGYYLWDEPVDAMPYATAYEYIKKAHPESYVHLNFLPLFHYYTLTTQASAVTMYQDVINRWLKANSDCGYPQDYLMYDMYPFVTGAQGMNREEFFKNIEVIRRLGLENDVKTAMYLQSVGIEGAYRSPSIQEIRYEAMLAMAFGMKQVSYFSWFTPVDRGREVFFDGIISPDGVPSDKYPDIAALNGEIHTLGTHLINLDALEVYMNGTQYGTIQPIPATFFAQPQNSEEYTISYLRDKETGRNYMMVVNNDYTKSTRVQLKLDEEITELYRVSSEDGSLNKAVIADGGNYQVTLQPGDGALFALPEGYDCER